MPRVRDGTVFPALPILACRGHKRADGDAHRTGPDRSLPQRRTARACGCGSGSRPQILKQGRAREAFRNARLPPRGVSPLLTSPCPARCTGRFGRSPYFRHRRLLRRSLRPRGGTRRTNSLYQCSVTVGSGYNRTCLWAPSLPLPGFRACNSLLLIKRGEQPAPGASKITVYRLQPALAAWSKSRITPLGCPLGGSQNIWPFWPTVASALGKLYSE
jgi:hypothetical protein